MKKQYLFVALLLVATAVYGSYIAGRAFEVGSGPVLSFEEPTPDDSAEYWSYAIETLGPEKAYAEFVAFNRGRNAGAQHNNAHVFGGVLYEEMGKEGLAVCDSSFSFGCYHEFLGMAINREGLLVVRGLNEACFKDLEGQALSCQHGIGHGIQTYLGYEFDNLVTALDICSDLPYNDPVGGCYGGVFMEYNLRTMLSSDGVGQRRFDPDNPHDPCSVLSQETQLACYYWQPQWWAGVFAPERTAVEVFQKIGELCHEIRDGETRRECFEGAGNIAGERVGYDPQKTIALCKAASAGVLQDEVYCRADAANSFFVVPEAQDRATLVCEGLQGDSKDFCERYGTNVFNKAEPGPSLGLQWCL